MKWSAINCGTIWDPYTAELAHNVEMVQRRASQFVLRRYYYQSSVGSMVSQLGWETLQERRAKSRLVLMYKANNQQIAVDSRLYLFPIAVPTRQAIRLPSATSQPAQTTTNTHITPGQYHSGTAFQQK